MKTVKRTLGILLAVTLLIGMFIVPVGAVTDPPAYSASYQLTAANSDYADESGWDFRAWLQYDPRWSDLPLGTGSGTTNVGQEGCTITSIAKLMIEAGLATPTELDPGVLVRYLNEHGGFVTSGAYIGSLNWGVVSTFAKDVLGKDFAFQSNYFDSGTLSSTDSSYKDRIISWLNQGYHLVLYVGRSYGTHWIAVDEYATLADTNTEGEIYIMDSWRTNPDHRCDIPLSTYLRTYYNTTDFWRIAAYKTDPPVKEKIILGDTDGDDEVTILDATAIQRHLASLPNQAFNEKAADTDQDASVTILDATAIQRHLASLPTQTEGIGKAIT